MPHRIAIVLTSHTRLGDTGKPTGFWYEELAAPFYVFSDAGHVSEIFCVGGAASPDPLSLTPEGGRGPIVDRFLGDPKAVAALETVRSVDQLSAPQFDAVFLVGGHGAMWDFPANEALARAIASMHARGAVVAAVCHGPAGLVGVRGADGAPLVSGCRTTGFTNAEEQVVGLTDVVPFLLETRLREEGAVFENRAPFSPHALRDGHLVTGQNPQSSTLAARLVLEALRRG